MNFFQAIILGLVQALTEYLPVSSSAHIRIIGEPILKKQLQRMLDSKRLSKIDEIDLLKTQMSEIQQKIKKLEGGK